MKTLLDAGPLVAILNAEDAHHEWAVDHARRLEAPFLTCEAVLSEAHFLLQDTPGGRSRLIEIAESDRLRVPFSYTAHTGRVHDLVRTYSDLPASFADARVFTVDSDVRVYQKHGRAPIPVLMPPSDGS